MGGATLVWYGAAPVSATRRMDLTSVSLMQRKNGVQAAGGRGVSTKIGRAHV